MPNGESYTDPGYEPGDPIRTPAPAEPSPGVDLAAWARGEEDAPLNTVLAAIDKYALGEVEKLASAVARIATRADAIEFLISEGLVNEDEVVQDDDD